MVRTCRQRRPAVTDDYHCFLLDPRLAADRSSPARDVLPGNAAVVHHAILFTRRRPPRWPPPRRTTRRRRAAGWTCFGGTALPNRTTTALSALDSAPWLAAWAPGGGESVFGRGTGKLLEKGSRVVLQVHYNLRAGRRRTRRRSGCGWPPRTPHLKAAQTMLLVAPVELPCTAGGDRSAVRPPRAIST